MVSFTLRKAGYEVGEACDGRDRMARARQSKFDMIITDLNMPNLDGIQMIAAVRSLQGYAFTPILMLTTSLNLKRRRGTQGGGNRMDRETVQRRSTSCGRPETSPIAAAGRGD